MRTPRRGPLHRLARGLITSALLLTALAGACTTAEDAAPQARPVAQTSATPTVLRVATNEGPDTPTGSAITSLAHRVEQLSGGALRLAPVWEAAGSAPDDWDQAVARTVVDGGNQLGYVPARAFDVLGVDTLQPLQTPLLLTSPARVDRVVRSRLADDLMKGLEEIGLVGLGLFPEELRRIFSYGEPITKPTDLSGRMIRAPRSDMTEAVFAMVGAKVDDPSGDAWVDAVKARKVHGAESSVPFMARLGSDHPPTTVTGNVVVFPKVNVLVINAEAFEKLDEAHRALLRRAAGSLLAEPGLMQSDSKYLPSFCAVGGRVVNASAADVAALAAEMARTEPPLSPSPARELARSVEELVAGLPAGTPLATCTTASRTTGTATSPATADAGHAGPPSTVPEGTLMAVDTQISDRPLESPVRHASGAFRTCTSVRDLTADIDDSDPAVTQFSGTKLVTCGDSTVTIAYDAAMETAAPGSTSGSWRIIASTLTTARSGGGRLTGSTTSCQVVPPADECIRDLYAGSVRP